MVVEPPLGVLELQVCGVEHLEVVVVAVGAPLVPLGAAVGELPVSVQVELLEVEQVATPVVLEERGRRRWQLLLLKAGE